MLRKKAIRNSVNKNLLRMLVRKAISSVGIAVRHTVTSPGTSTFASSSSQVAVSAEQSKAQPSPIYMDVQATSPMVCSILFFEGTVYSREQAV